MAGVAVSTQSVASTAVAPAGGKQARSESSPRRWTKPQPSPTAPRGRPSARVLDVPPPPTPRGLCPAALADGGGGGGGEEGVWSCALGFAPVVALAGDPERTKASILSPTCPCQPKVDFLCRCWCCMHLICILRRWICVHPHLIRSPATLTTSCGPRRRLSALRPLLRLLLQARHLLHLAQDCV